MAAHGAHMNMTYGVSKAGMNALTKSMAIHNARYGIRVNAIMPGLMDTPMAIERRAREQDRSRDDIRAERARQVPLLGQQGTGWDVANAALFLASDDARYITGVCLPVDGGLSRARVNHRKPEAPSVAGSRTIIASPELPPGAYPPVWEGRDALAASICLWMGATARG